TDAMLSGQQRQASPEAQGLDQIAQQLSRMVSSSAGPDPAFRAQLTQRLMQEWDTTAQRGSRMPTSRILSRRYMQYAALAAVVILLLGLALILGSNGPAVGTTVGGEFPWDAVLIILFGLGIAALIILRRRR